LFISSVLHLFGVYNGKNEVVEYKTIQHDNGKTTYEVSRMFYPILYNVKGDVAKLERIGHKIDTKV
jgi:hypothetical protein